MRPIVWILLLAGTTVTAQETARRQPPTATTPVEMAPIECYWRTSVSAVRVGEPFTVVLTCGVVATASTTVIVEQGRLDPGAIALQPFEVLDGTSAPDVRTSTHRYFQYEYRLRYLGEEIGRDHQLPDVTITYRVQSRTQGSGAAVEGRERRYRLASRAIRVVSLLPATAADIREPAPPTFESIEERRFNASALRVVAWVLFALSGLAAAFAAIRGVRRRRPDKPVGPAVSDAAALRAVSRELAAIRSARHPNGWDDALIARALAALRVAAAYEAEHPVAQSYVRDGDSIGGQLHIDSRWPRRRGVALSAAATASSLTGLETTASNRPIRDGLADALRALTAAIYGRHTAPHDESALDDALRAGDAAVRVLRRRHGWIGTRARAARRQLLGLGPERWMR